MAHGKPEGGGGLPKPPARNRVKSRVSESWCCCSDSGSDSRLWNDSDSETLLKRRFTGVAPVDGALIA